MNAGIDRSRDATLFLPDGVSRKTCTWHQLAIGRTFSIGIEMAAIICCRCHAGSSARPRSGSPFRVRPTFSRGPTAKYRSSSSNTEAPPAREPTIFSGIQPTGVPHLGNYLGALRQWVKLQDEAKSGTKLFFSIVDLHALTVPQEASQLRKWRTEAFATLLAVGLNPQRSTIFYQSAVGDAPITQRKRAVYMGISC